MALAGGLLAIAFVVSLLLRATPPRGRGLTGEVPAVG
jgi:hypothetical protein